MYSIDVVIPCYYAPEIIQPCFEKLAAQTYRCFKVIMINDCSPFTDDEYAGLRQHYSQLMDLRYYKTDKNSGPGIVRQFGLNVANSDFIMFIDDDDELYDEFALERLINKVNNKNIDNIMLIDGQSMQVWDNGKTELLPPNYHHHATLYNLTLIKQNHIHYESDLSYKEEDCAFSAWIYNIVNTYNYNTIEVYKPIYLKKWSDNHISLTSSSSTIDSFIYLIGAKYYDMLYSLQLKNKYEESLQMVPISFSNLTHYMANNKEAFLTQKQYDRLVSFIERYCELLNKYMIDLSKTQIDSITRTFFDEFFTEKVFYGKWNENDIYLFPLAYKHNLSFLAQQIRD